MKSKPLSRIVRTAIAGNDQSSEQAAVQHFLRKLTTYTNIERNVRNRPVVKMTAARRTDSDARTNWRGVSEICVKTAHELQDECLGLLDLKVPPGWFFLLAHYLANSADLRSAVERMNAHSNACINHFRFTLREDAGDGFLEIRPTPGTRSVNPLIYDILIIQRYQLLCWLAQIDIPIVGLYMPYKNSTHFEYLGRIFNDPELIFGTDFAACRFPLTYLKSPVIANARSLAASSAYFLQNDDSSNYQLSDLSQKLREILSAEIEAGPANLSLDRVSNLMGIPSYTLQRVLRDRGTTFQSLRDSIRADLSKKMLDNGHYSIGEVSERMGFREASSFSRAFKSWTGKNPSWFIKGESKRREISIEATQ